VESYQTMSITFAEFARYTFSPDGRDTTRDLSDEELGRAIVDTGDLHDAAVALGQQRGRIVARTDIADRIAGSAYLQRVYETAQTAHMEQAIDSCLRRNAEDRQLAKLQRERNRGPRCGARTRSGAPCQRKPALGKSRCPNHGGASPVIGPGRRRT
jgi:hypothetical protein